MRSGRPIRRFSDMLRDRLAGLSLRTRMVTATIALLAAVSLVVGLLSLLLLREHLIDQRDQQLEAAAERASAAYTRARAGDRRPDDGLGTDVVPFFLNAPGQIVGIVSAQIVDGQVRHAGTLDPGGVSTLASGPALDMLLRVQPGRGPQTRKLGKLGGYRLVAEVRSDHVTLVTGLPLNEVDDIVDRLGVIVLAVALAGLVLAGAASAVVVRINLRPLDRVAATAGRVSRLRLDRGEVALAERVPAGDTDPRTEVGQVGAALNTMIEHVGAALAARHASETQLRQFLADASHELRTPLAAIRGYAELAGRSTDPLPPDVAHALRRVSSQAERMTSLVEDMLLLARLDAGRPLVREQVDVSQLVVDAVSDAHATVPDHRWTLALPDEAITVTGDSARLSQVLSNLLANAGTHTPPDTTVRAELANGSDEVVLTVLDDGPGIPPELLPRVFARFARGDSSRSRAAGSTGLGLAIAYAVVVAHGGTISVESEPGRTAFTVRLPSDPHETPVPAGSAGSAG
ncbi:MAG TPA: ATP-binding protein [Pseudonocardia sp.]|nr:ATP-binding protein [Pseudonocardia sp.]